MSVTVPSRRIADPSTPVPVKEGLFRREVIAERQTQWLGTVLLAPRISHSLVSLLAVLAAAGVLELLFLGGYTRKIRINGWLVPEAGLVRLFAPQSGVVVQQYAHEGIEVAKGKPLLVLSTEIQSETLGATRREVVRQLQSRRDSLAVGRERQRI